jgi:hypothetical protein
MPASGADDLLMARREAGRLAHRKRISARAFHESDISGSHGDLLSKSGKALMPTCCDPR